MHEKYGRFPWCSTEEEAAQRLALDRMSDVTPNLYEGMGVWKAQMAMSCGDMVNVAPAGASNVQFATKDLGDGVPAFGQVWKTETPWKTFLDLNVTTSTTTCPTFSSAFANAFAFTAQIEIVITMVLLFVTQKVGMVKAAEGMVDIGVAGAHGVVSKAVAKELVGQAASAPARAIATPSQSV